MPDSDHSYFPKLADATNRLYAFLLDLKPKKEVIGQSAHFYKELALASGAFLGRHKVLQNIHTIIEHEWTDFVREQELIHGGKLTDEARQRIDKEKLSTERDLLLVAGQEFIEAAEHLHSVLGKATPAYGIDNPSKIRGLKLINEVIDETRKAIPILPRSGWSITPSDN